VFLALSSEPKTMLNALVEACLVWFPGSFWGYVWTILGNFCLEYRTKFRPIVIVFVPIA